MNFLLQILTGRLVERSAGDYLIINPKAFYNLLSAWVSNDAIAYVASQADLQPLPREWYHSIYDHELKSKFFTFKFIFLTPKKEKGICPCTHMHTPLLICLCIIKFYAYS